MASRYWVGGTSTWDATAGTKWALTSGGAGGQAVPTTSDDVFFDTASGNVTVNIPTFTTSNCLSLNFTGYTGSLSWGSSTLNVAGSFTLSATTKLVPIALLALNFTATTSVTLTSAGKRIPAGINFNGVGGTWTLQDDFDCTFSGTSTFTLTNGTFNANNFNVTATGFVSSNANTRVITMGSGTWLLTGPSAWGVTTSTGLTLNANTSTLIISDSSTSAVVFAGGGLTYNNVFFSRSGSTGTITISGSNTFNEFKDTGNAAHSILFTAATTQTMVKFTAFGSSGNVITLNSTTTGTFSLVKTGGTLISSNWLNIQHSVATPANTWYAGANSTNNQAVATAGSGWIFTAPPIRTITGIQSITGISTITF